MRGKSGDVLAEVEVHLELGPVDQGTALLPRGKAAAVQRFTADKFASRRMLGDAFRLAGLRATHRGQRLDRRPGAVVPAGVQARVDRNDDGVAA